MKTEQDMRDNVIVAIHHVKEAMRVHSKTQEFFDQTSKGWEEMDVARDRMKASMVDLNLTMQEYTQEV